jgi:hypothetical protein
MYESGRFRICSSWESYSNIVSSRPNGDINSNAHLGVSLRRTLLLAVCGGGRSGLLRRRHVLINVHCSIAIRVFVKIRKDFLRRRGLRGGRLGFSRGLRFRRNPFSSFGLSGCLCSRLRLRCESVCSARRVCMSYATHTGFFLGISSKPSLSSDTSEIASTS